MRIVLPLLVALGLGALSWNVSGATQKKKTPAKKTAVKKSTAAKKVPAKKSTVTAHKRSSTTRRKATSSRRRKPAQRTTWRNRQMQPTPDRYKEIQEALVAKGFLQPEQATGVWNDASADALKKFQAGQNLEPNGKISSLSLIALGLGPKRDSAPAPIAAPVTPAVPQTPPGGFEQ